VAIDEEEEEAVEEVEAIRFTILVMWTWKVSIRSVISWNDLRFQAVHKKSRQ
jgi:hypothetical protein